MILFKDRLPNDNIVIWFGTEDNDLINNAMILAGGDVLIFKVIHKIETNKFEIKNDLLNMSIQDFIEKYSLYDNKTIEKNLEFTEINLDNLKGKIFELLKDLKDGLLLEKYPPYVTKYKDKINDNKRMISKYLYNISNTSNFKEAIYHLTEVIAECGNKIQNLLKQTKQSPLYNEFNEIQKDIHQLVNLVKNKTQIMIKKIEELENQL